MYQTTRRDIREDSNFFFFLHYGSLQVILLYKAQIVKVVGNVDFR